MKVPFRRGDLDILLVETDGLKEFFPQSPTSLSLLLGERRFLLLWNLSVNLLRSKLGSWGMEELKLFACEQI